MGFVLTVNKQKNWTTVQLSRILIFFQLATSTKLTKYVEPEGTAELRSKTSIEIMFHSLWKTAQHVSDS